MRNLLLVSGEYPPTVGGVAHYSYRLVTGLTEIGWLVKVATVTRKPRWQPPDHTLSLGYRWGWPALARTLHLAKVFGADVISLQYQTGCYAMHPAVNLLPLALKFAGRPTVTTFHDMLAPYLFPKAGRIRQLANLMLVAASERVVLVDPGDLPKIPERFRSRVRLVPIGPNVLPPEVVDLDHRRNSFGYRLVYFGLANMSKGLDLAIATMARLLEMGPNVPWELRIVGGGVATDPQNVQYRRHCVELVSLLKLQDRVTFVGEVGEEEVRRELLGADVAILPYRDGVSYRRGSLLVCLSHGLPVVTCGPLPQSPPPGWPIFQNGYNLVACPSGDPECLAQQVARLADEHDVRFAIAGAALKTADFFRWDTICSQMSSVFIDVEKAV